MKKTTEILVFILLITVCLNLSADVIPEDSHELERILTVEDTEDLEIYPGATVYGYHTGGKVGDAEVYEVKPGLELNKGYKNNDFYLYWAFDDLFDLSSFNYDVNSEEPLSHPELRLLTDEINPGTYYVDEDDPLIKEEITYKVYYEDSTVRIYKSKLVKTYNDDTPSKTEDFSPEETDITADNSNNNETPDELEENDEKNDMAVEVSDSSNQSSGGNTVNVDGCSILFVE